MLNVVGREEKELCRSKAIFFTSETLPGMLTFSPISSVLQEVKEQQAAKEVIPFQFH